MRYVFVIRDYSEIELVLERELIEANLREGTGREDLTLHATGKDISCRREKQRKEKLIV